MSAARLRAMFLMGVMLLAPLSGCFGEAEKVDIAPDALTVEGNGALLGAMWQPITVTAKEDLAVYVPYFIQDPGSLRAQNGTVLDLNAGESVSMNILFPPRNEDVVFFISDIGRTD